MVEEPLMTEEQFGEERIKSDDIWSDYDVFEEGRDQLDFHALVLRIVEGIYTHPFGVIKHDIDDSVNGFVWDYIDTWCPPQLSGDDKRKFANDLESELIQASRTLFDATEDEVESLGDDAKVSELSAILQDQLETENIRETY